MVVQVETEPTFIAGNPKELFQGTYFSSGFIQIEVTPWNIHPDGDRFLMIKPTAATDGGSAEVLPPKINVVLNWFEKLKQKAPLE